MHRSPAAQRYPQGLRRPAHIEIKSRGPRPRGQRRLTGSGPRDRSPVSSRRPGPSGTATGTIGNLIAAEEMLSVKTFRCAQKAFDLAARPVRRSASDDSGSYPHCFRKRQAVQGQESGGITKSARRLQRRPTVKTSKGRGDHPIHAQLNMSHDCPEIHNKRRRALPRDPHGAHHAAAVYKRWGSDRPRFEIFQARSAVGRN